MLDRAFLEFVAVFGKTEFLVERHGLRLCVQFQIGIVQCLRLFDEQIEHDLQMKSVPLTAFSKVSIVLL